MFSTSAPDSALGSTPVATLLDAYLLQTPDNALQRHRYGWTAWHQGSQCYECLLNAHFNRICPTGCLSTGSDVQKRLCSCKICGGQRMISGKRGGIGLPPSCFFLGRCSQHSSALSRSYVKIDPELPLNKALRGARIIEYPTLYIVLPEELVRRGSQVQFSGLTCCSCDQIL